MGPRKRKQGKKRKREEGRGSVCLRHTQTGKDKEEKGAGKKVAAQRKNFDYGRESGGAV